MSNDSLVQSGVSVYRVFFVVVGQGTSNFTFSHVSLRCDVHASTECLQAKIVKQWFDFSGQLISFGGADVLECSCTISQHIV